MASDPRLAVQAGENFANLISGGTLPPEFRDQGMSTLGHLSYIYRGETKFMHMLTKRFPKPKSVSDRKHVVPEVTEFDRTFTVQIASNDTNHKTFALTNDQGAQLQVQDILFNTKLYTTVVSDVAALSQSVAGTDVGPTLIDDYSRQPTSVAFSRTRGVNAGNYFHEYEQMLVKSIGDKDSAGFGYRNITVERCFHAAGKDDQGGAILGRGLVNTSIQANAATASIQAEDVLLRGVPSFPEGTNAPNGIYKAPTLDNNFTQEFKYAIEATKESKINKSRLKVSQLELSRFLTGRRMMYDIERAYLFGRKGYRVDNDGREQFTMGGVVEHIPKDADHCLTYNGSQITYPGMLDLTEKIFRNGGSEKRDAYCGIGIYTKLKKAYEGHENFRFNREDTAKFDIQVDSIVGAGGMLNLIPLYSMTEAGYDNSMIVIDWSNPCYKPVTHPGWDMKLEKDIGEKGLQVYKEQVIGIKGLERRYGQYNCLVDFNAS